MITRYSVSQLQLQTIRVTLPGKTRTFRPVLHQDMVSAAFYLVFPRTLIWTWQLGSLQESFPCKSNTGSEKGCRIYIFLCPVSTGFFYYYFISPFGVPFSNPSVFLNSINTQNNRILNGHLGFFSFLLFVYLSKVDTLSSPRVGLIHMHTEIFRLWIR